MGYIEGGGLDCSYYYYNTLPPPATLGERLDKLHRDVQSLLQNPYNEILRGDVAANIYQLLQESPSSLPEGLQELLKEAPPNPGHLQKIDAYLSQRNSA